MGMTGEQAYVLAKKLIEAGGGGGGTVDAYTKTQTDNLLIQKVDKEAGKGLFSGSYNDLSDAPTIPTKTSELQNDSGYLTEQAVSDEWNDTTTYEVGQYCIFSNRLWKCLIQNSGEAPQEGTYWTQTSIDNEINELNSNLQGQINTVNSNLTEMFKFVTYAGTVKSIGKLSGIGSYSNYTQLEQLTVPSIDGYTIKHVSVRSSNYYVFICYNISFLNGTATITGNGFSCANSAQNCSIIADVIYQKN